MACFFVCLARPLESRVVRPNDLNLPCKCVDRLAASVLLLGVVDRLCELDLCAVVAEDVLAAFALVESLA